MVVTKPRLANSQRHDPGIVHLSPSYRRSRPVALRNDETTFWTGLAVCGWRSGDSVASTTASPAQPACSTSALPACNRSPHPSPHPTPPPDYGDGCPTGYAYPSSILPRTPTFVHRFLPPAARVQRASHTPRARHGVLQRADRPRLGPDIIKPIRLECAEDHSSPHHPPRCVSRPR